MNKYRIAILIPCYNEATTIKSVINDFQSALPQASVHVFDNKSSDKTGEIAKKEGAIVHFVGLPGKGNVVRRMFADVEADIYVMVDGDGTYDASSAPKIVHKLINENLDMVVGCRTENSKQNNNYRPGHRIGNRVLTTSVQKMFDGSFTDMLSGYRAFSKRFVKSFPAESRGFEIETELTVHALELKLPCGEVDTPYSERPEGSESKLSTYRDGAKILIMIGKLYSNERPKEFWSIIGGLLLFVALILLVPVLAEYSATKLVPRFPTFIFALFLLLSGFFSFSIGLVLRTVTKGRREAKHYTYLSIASLQELSNDYVKKT